MSAEFFSQHSSYIEKTSCDDCGSSDARAIYDDHSFCYSCGTYKGEADGEAVKPKKGLILDCQFKALTKRGISQATCKKFGYGQGISKGRGVQVAPYFSDGKLVAQKLRYKNKEFKFIGSPKEAQLFGQQLWREGGRRITIAEGEIDALSISEAYDNNWPVVSVKNGAAGAAKELQAHLEFLQSFESVVIAFDNDEPGRKAAEQCAQLFEPGKARIANWQGFKDANELLCTRGPSAVYKSCWEAKTWRPDGILEFKDTWENIIEVNNSKNYTLGLPKLDAATQGIRKGEITLITAGSGIGKSTFCKEMIYHLHEEHGAKVGAIALEEKVGETARALMSIKLNKRLNLLDREDMDDGELREAFQHFANTGRVVLYDHFGSLESQNLLNKIRYMFTGLGCDFVVLDHISIAIAGSEGTDERKDIDRLMSSLASMVESTGGGLIIVSHLKKTDGKPHEEGGEISCRDLRGSGSLYQFSWNIFALERNQQGENPNYANIRGLKCRHTGKTGLFDVLYYDDSTGRFQKSDYDPSKSEESFGTCLDDDNEAEPSPDF